MLTGYIMVILFWASSVLAQNKCCGGPDNILINKLCKNGEDIIGIQCKHKYLISPEIENFTVLDDGSLFEEGGSPIAVDKYCLTTEFRTNGTNVDIALACFPDPYPMTTKAFFTFKAVCSLISVLFLTATIIVYILVPSLRDLQGKCILHSITALDVAMLLLGILQFGVTMEGSLCHIIGYATFAAFLIAFTWLNAISFHIWRTTVIPGVLGTNKQWYFLYCFWGYGVPTVILISAIAAHHAPGDHVKPGIGEFSCWFSGRDATWAYFYGPVAFLLIVNLFLFLWTAKRLWKDVKEAANSSKIRSLRYRCLLYIKLFFIMGLSWCFEIISYAAENQDNFVDYIWLITDFINGLQGVLVFLILVAFRKRALRGLAKRGLFCIHLPQQWKTLQDEECEEVVEEEQLAHDNINEEQLYKPKENQSV